MATRIDPYGQFNFLLQIDGVTQAGFSEVSGLTTDTNIIEYREGADNIYGVNTVRKLVGLIKYTNIVCKRGWTKDASLWQWRKLVLDGNTQRQDGTIVLLDEARNKVLSWDWSNGWPVKWEGPALNAKTSEVAIETLEIAIEALVLGS
ncbi:MAG: phage tail protein [Candidatus Cybelea sp.]